MASLFRKLALVLALLAIFLTGSTAFAATPAARVHISNNWAGYAATDETYTGVSGAWTVPFSTKSDKVISADAAWVGIGGVSASDLIQAGTQAIVRGGRTEYIAWYELLPDTQQTAALAVRPGDHVFASVREITPGQWSITIQNLTTRQTYQNTVAYNSSHSSAEWIVERPLAVTNNATGYLPLSNFSDVTFDTATLTTTTGKTESVENANAQRLIMSGTGSRLLAAPDDVNDGTFSVSYLSTTQSSRYLRTLRRTYILKPSTTPASSGQNYQQINTSYVIRIIFDGMH